MASVLFFCGGSCEKFASEMKEIVPEGLDEALRVGLATGNKCATSGMAASPPPSD